MGGERSEYSCKLGNLRKFGFEENDIKISAVIVDKDGVLIDSELRKAAAWDATLSAYGVHGGYQWYLGALGPTAAVLSENARLTFRISSSANLIEKNWAEKYDEFKQRVMPIVANVELLRQLSSRFDIAVASAMDQESIRRELKSAGCYSHVSAISSGEDVPHNKPKPDVYFAAAKKMGRNPKECIAIEDSPAGVQSAKAAGMYCLGYRNPHYTLDLSEADVIFDDLWDFPLFRGE